MTRALIETLNYTPTELTFGTSGLRGLVTDMTDLECYINARGFLQFLVTAGNAQPGATVMLGGDLRDSTPRIMTAVWQAIIDSGFTPANVGLVPTPTVAYYAQENDTPCIVVTGSHIPSDRNGIKFYKLGGEVLKEDEQAIQAAVADVRARVYASVDERFDTQGSLVEAVTVTPTLSEAAAQYTARYTDCFDENTLKSKHIVAYQHSAVGRDLLVELLEKLGATVTPVGRTDVFTPIDSENVTEADEAYFAELIAEYPDAFAIVSTDGDSDRPFVIDEKGVFHRGDVLGAVVADYLGIKEVALPISSSDAVDQHLDSKGIPFTHTKIGSPYVIKAMQAMSTTPVAGWEVNGGFLLGSDIKLGGGTLKALPTRDAFLPIIAALHQAAKNDISVSAVFDELPQRFTSASLLDNFDVASSKAIITKLSSSDADVLEILNKVFNASSGFSTVKDISTIDGIRIFFENGEIAHVRPSGNAPQLRIYSVADSQERANQIVAMGLSEPNGLLRNLEKLCV